MSTGPDSLAPGAAWFAGCPVKSSPDAHRLSVLVGRSREGCHESYRKVVDLHRDRIYRFCLGWTGNPEDAEELCQDTFVRAYSALPGYQGEDRFAAWLYRIARNRCHDHHRSRARRDSAKNRPLGSADSAEFVSSSPRPDEDAAGSEDLRLLQRAIAALPERLREVVILCGMEGLSQGDCAAMLGCSVRAVEGRLYRARLELASQLGGERV